MKKISILFIVCCIVIGLTGCSEQAYEDYSKAIAKTYGEKIGKTALHMSTKIDYDKEGLSVDAITELSRYGDMRLDMAFSYDMREEPKIAADVYTNTAGAGMDYNYYKDGDKEFIRLPIIKKYVAIESVKEVAQESQQNIFIDVSKMWIAMLEEDDVIKGQNTIIDSEEGQVKAKVVTVTLRDDQLKSLGGKLLEVLGKRGIIERFLNKDMSDSKERLELIKKAVAETVITHMTLTAYIDFDGYLIREEIVVGLDLKKSLGNAVKSVEVIINKENWDIGKKQGIVIPEIGADDQIPMSELKNMENILGF